MQAIPQLLQRLSDATVGVAHALRLRQLPWSTADECTARVAFVAQSFQASADEVSWPCTDTAQLAPQCACMHTARMHTQALHMQLFGCVHRE